MPDIFEMLENIGIFNLPIDQDELLRAVVAAQTRGFIRTEFKRITVWIPIGSTVTNTIDSPEGRILKYINVDRVMPEFHDELLTVTLVIDSQEKIYTDIPLTRDLEVDPVFFPFVEDKIQHTITNNGVSDAQFTNDIQVLNIDKAFFDEVLSPTFQGQYRAIRKFAERVGV